MRIMQWCLPFPRQQGGRFASGLEANIGAISNQLNQTSSDSAIERRISEGILNMVMRLLIYKMPLLDLFCKKHLRLNAPSRSGSLPMKCPKWDTSR